MGKPTTLVAPSILAADFARLGEEVEQVSSAGADWIHCDVMDGHFVDNISFGSEVVKAAGRHTRLPLDVHLMIERPDHYLERYLPWSASVTVHIEARHEVSETLRRVRAAGCRAGLALSPATPLTRVEPLLGEFDILLVMTVVPGFGGQPFLPEMLEKVRTAAEWRGAGRGEFLIEVDGGIHKETAGLCRAAGAEVLVAGTAVFGAEDRAAAMAELRRAG